MNVHDELALTDAIIFSLEGAGLAVGDAIAPDPLPAQGYVVVLELTGGTTDGSIGRPDDDASVIYQMTSIGKDARQCRWVARKVRRTLLDAYLPLLGDRIVSMRTVDMLGGVLRDDDVQPPVFYSPDRYRIWTTPLVAA